MSLRRFLLFPLIISLGLFAYYSAEVIDSFHYLMRNIEISADLIMTLCAAILLQIAGQIMRAYKMKFLMQPIKANTVRFQFRALVVGYLFNSILPFRLGELVRARVISGGMNISFSLALVFVIFERAVDAVALVLLGVFIIPHLLFGVGVQVVSYMLGISTLALVFFVFLMLLRAQNRGLMQVWYHTTKLFNEGIKNSLRFKLWSVIYGIQRTLTSGRIVKYLAISACSWFLYVTSMLVVVEYF